MLDRAQCDDAHEGYYSPILGLQQNSRKSLQFDPVSDCQPLDGLVAAMLATSSRIHCLRDATRGGVATVLNEFAQSSNVAIRIHQSTLALHSLNLQGAAHAAASISG